MSANLPSLEGCLTARQAAESLSIHLNTLRKKVGAGEIPVIVHNRAHRFRPEALEAYRLRRGYPWPYMHRRNLKPEGK